MDADLDWPSVYPVAAPFKPSAVPLPVRMGYPVKKGVPMAKEGNLELLKVSGWFGAHPHPTPPHQTPPHPSCAAGEQLLMCQTFSSGTVAVAGGKKTQSWACEKTGQFCGFPVALSSVPRKWNSGGQKKQMLKISSDSTLID